jgi:hypothetical protein
MLSLCTKRAPHVLCSTSNFYHCIWEIQPSKWTHTCCWTNGTPTWCRMIFHRIHYIHSLRRHIFTRDLSRLSLLRMKCDQSTENEMFSVKWCHRILIGAYVKTHHWHSSRNKSHSWNLNSNWKLVAISFATFFSCNLTRNYIKKVVANLQLRRCTSRDTNLTVLSFRNINITMSSNLILSWLKFSKTISSESLETVASLTYRGS